MSFSGEKVCSLLVKKGFLMSIFGGVTLWFMYYILYNKYILLEFQYNSTSLQLTALKSLIIYRINFKNESN